jgi:hypothetical protein
MEGSSCARVLQQRWLSEILILPRNKTTDRHRLFIAALPALYGPQPGMPPTAAPELTKMMRPPSSLARRSRKDSWTAVTNEKKLTSKWVLQAFTSCSGFSILETGSRTAAFKIRASIFWYLSRAVEITSANRLSSALLTCQRSTRVQPKETTCRIEERLASEGMQLSMPGVQV